MVGSVPVGVNAGVEVAEFHGGSIQHRDEYAPSRSTPFESLRTCFDFAQVERPRAGRGGNPAPDSSRGIGMTVRMAIGMGVNRRVALTWDWGDW